MVILSKLARLYWVVIFHLLARLDVLVISGYLARLYLLDISIELARLLFMVIFRVMAFFDEHRSAGKAEEGGMPHPRTADHHPVVFCSFSAFAPTESRSISIVNVRSWTSAIARIISISLDNLVTPRMISRILRTLVRLFILAVSALSGHRSGAVIFTCSSVFSSIFLEHPLELPWKYPVVTMNAFSYKMDLDF